MKNGPHQWRRRLLLVSGLLGVVGLVAGGIAYATIPGGLYGDINVCVKTSTGHLHPLTPSAAATTSTSREPSRRSPNATSHTPSGNWSSNLDAACVASAVLPTPPMPVSVTS